MMSVPLYDYMDKKDVLIESLLIVKNLSKSIILNNQDESEKMIQIQELILRSRRIQEEVSLLLTTFIDEEKN